MSKKLAVIMSANSKCGDTGAVANLLLFGGLQQPILGVQQGSHMAGKLWMAARDLKEIQQGKFGHPLVCVYEENSVDGRLIVLYAKVEPDPDELRKDLEERGYTFREPGDDGSLELLVVDPKRMHGS